MDNVLKRILELIGDKRGEKTRFFKALHLQSSTLGDWQGGKTTSYLKIIPQIAEYFSVSTDYLLKGETEEKEKATDDPKLDDLQFALYKETEELTEQDKRDVLDFAKYIKEKRRKDGR